LDGSIPSPLRGWAMTARSEDAVWLVVSQAGGQHPRGRFGKPHGICMAARLRAPSAVEHDGRMPNHSVSLSQ
jgi:hypothetical protein